MFSHLRDVEANKVDAPRPVDLTPECCTLMERLMLAQAQVGGVGGEWGGVGWAGGGWTVWGGGWFGVRGFGL